jgi:type II secretory pathway pseudopilin PulG
VVELVMVVIMIGIAAAMVIPKVRVDNASVDSVVRSVNLTLMTAQREAVSRQHNVLVVIDTAHHIARTIWDANNNGVADNGERSRPVPLPDVVVIGRPSGVPKLGGSAEIEVSTPGDPTIVLLRSGATDRSRVLYFTSRRSLAGGTFHDARAVRIARATGRPNWYVWSGTAWRRG